MNLNQFILTIASLFVLHSCSENNDLACFSFDQRSCQEDPWADLETDEPLEERVSSYLSSEGIDVERIEIDFNFHEVVCLACGVCPDGPRIFVSISPNLSERLTSLNLLNFATEACTSN